MHDILFSQLCASHSANTVNASDQTSASVILDMPAKPAIKVGKLCDTSKQSQALSTPASYKNLSSHANHFSITVVTKYMRCHFAERQKYNKGKSFKICLIRVQLK